jgi:hypothetical protein
LLFAKKLDLKILSLINSSIMSGHETDPSASSSSLTSTSISQPCSVSTSSSSRGVDGCDLDRNPQEEKKNGQDEENSCKKESKGVESLADLPGGTDSSGTIQYESPQKLWEMEFQDPQLDLAQQPWYIQGGWLNIHSI